MSFLINPFIYAVGCSGNAINVTNLSAYYKYNSDVTDSSGNGLNGTATDISYVAGKYDNAASFNGTSSFVSVADNALLEGSGGTISVAFWCKLSNISSGPQALSKWNGTSTGWRITPRASDILLTLGGANLAATVSNADNELIHIAFTYNNNNWVIYKNGVNSGSGATGARTLANTQVFAVGKASWAAALYCAGWIDDVSVWQRVLSASEIAVLAGSCPLKS